MKDSKSLKYIVIDFEGKNEKIREFTFVTVEASRIHSVSEHVEPDSKTLEREINFLSNSIFHSLVSHNSHIEKNFLTNISPYQVRENKILKWGPWIDTYKLYCKLYPNLKNYDLQSLTEQFVNRDILNELTDKFCSKDRRNFHYSTYDCICTHLLLKRLEHTINLQMFREW